MDYYGNWDQDLASIQVLSDFSHGLEHSFESEDHPATHLATSGLQINPASHSNTPANVSAIHPNTAHRQQQQMQQQQQHEIMLGPSSSSLVGSSCHTTTMLATPPMPICQNGPINGDSQQMMMMMTTPTQDGDVQPAIDFNAYMANYLSIYQGEPIEYTKSYYQQQPQLMQPQYHVNSNISNSSSSNSNNNISNINNNKDNNNIDLATGNTNHHNNCSLTTAPQHRKSGMASLMGSTVVPSMPSPVWQTMTQPQQHQEQQVQYHHQQQHHYNGPASVSSTALLSPMSMSASAASNGSATSEMMLSMSLLPPGSGSSPPSTPTTGINTITGTQKQSTTTTTCDICHMTFNNKRSLTKHLKAEHGERGVKKHACTLCPYRDDTRSGLRTHFQANHAGEKAHKCDKCQFATSDHNSFRRHKLRHDGLYPYNCPFCAYKSIQSCSYKDHLKKQHRQHADIDSYLFACEICGFTTISRAKLTSHRASCNKSDVENQSGTSSSDDSSTGSVPAPSVAN